VLDPESIDGTDDESVRERRRHVAYLNLFGCPPPTYKDERLAPPVDEAAIAKLRAYVRGEEMGPGEWPEVFALTETFRSWARAVMQARKEVRAEKLRKQTS